MIEYLLFKEVNTSVSEIFEVIWGAMWVAPARPHRKDLD